MREPINIRYRVEPEISSDVSSATGPSSLTAPTALLGATDLFTTLCFTGPKRSLDRQLEGLRHRIDICARRDFAIGPDWPLALEKVIVDTLGRWEKDALQRGATGRKLLHRGEQSDDVSSTVRGMALLGASEESLRKIEAITEELQRGVSGDSTYAYSRFVLLESTVEALRDEHTGAALSRLLSDDLDTLIEAATQRMKKEMRYPYVSPLSMVTKDETINEHLRELGELVKRVMHAPSVSHEFVVSQEGIEAVRSRMIDITLHAEADLHRFGTLLSNRFLGEQWGVHCEVCVERSTARGRSRAVVTEEIDPQELFTTTDLEFATRLVDGFGGSLVSSVFDYHRTDPDAEGRHGVRHVRTRVKAADSVVVKIADQLFRMDEAIGKKKVDDFTVYLKDVCGVAIVVRDEAEVRRVAQEIIKGRWTGKELEAAGVKVFDAARRFETFEVKEKLGKNDLSWRGIKIAGFWNGLCLEIQIKTEETLLREQAAHTAESHARYKTKREQMREHFAHDQPLYPFVRAYLRHLFIPGAPLPPAPETLTLKVGD